MAGSPISIELRHLRYLVAAAELGSFRKAAGHLGVRASTVSRRMTDLEDRIGSPLFLRHEGGVFLTQAGQTFLHRAKRVLGEIEHGARYAFDHASGTGNALRLGVPPSGCPPRLVELIRIFQRDKAEQRVVLVEGPEDTHRDALRRSELDVAFTLGRRPWPGCHVTRFGRVPLTIACPSGHGLLQKQAIEWGDVKGEPLFVGSSPIDNEIAHLAVRRLAERGFPRTVQRRDMGQANLLLLVALGQGLGLLEASNGSSPLGIEFRPLSHEAIPAGLAWPASHETQACQRFLGMIRRLPSHDKSLASVMRGGTADPPAAPS